MATALRALRCALQQHVHVYTSANLHIASRVGLPALANFVSCTRDQALWYPKKKECITKQAMSERYLDSRADIRFGMFLGSMPDP